MLLIDPRVIINSNFCRKVKLPRKKRTIIMHVSRDVHENICDSFVVIVEMLTVGYETKY